MHPPWPRSGAAVWAASPSSATRPRAKRSMRVVGVDRHVGHAGRVDGVDEPLHRRIPAGEVLRAGRPAGRRRSASGRRAGRRRRSTGRRARAWSRPAGRRRRASSTSSASPSAELVGDEAVPVVVAEVGALGRAADHVVAQPRVGAVGRDDEVGLELARRPRGARRRGRRRRRPRRSADRCAPRRRRRRRAAAPAGRTAAPGTGRSPTRSTSGSRLNSHSGRAVLVAVAHALHPAADRRDLGTEAEGVEHLHPVRPQRDARRRPDAARAPGRAPAPGARCAGARSAAVRPPMPPPTTTTSRSRTVSASRPVGGRSGQHRVARPAIGHGRLTIAYTLRHTGRNQPAAPSNPACQLQSHPEGRVYMTATASRPRRRRIATAYEATYAQLRRELLTDVIAPGMRLREVELAARLQVSRTPVREALRRLESDGFVERDADGGAGRHPDRPRRPRRHRPAAHRDRRAGRPAGRRPGVGGRLGPGVLPRVAAAHRRRRGRAGPHPPAAPPRDLRHRLQPAHDRVLQRPAAPLHRGGGQRRARARRPIPEGAFLQHLTLVRALSSGDAERAAEASREHAASGARFAKSAGEIAEPTTAKPRR